MAATQRTLPDLDILDTDTLRALVVSQHAELTSYDNEIDNLKLLIHKLKRMQFGASSEKLNRQIEQLELKLDDLEAAEASRPVPPLPKSLGVARRRPVRRPLPPELPRETETIPPNEKACPDCGGAFSVLGEDVSETLEYVPAHFKVLRTVRPKLSCTRCDCIVQAPAPNRPIDHGMAGAGLLAHVLVAKYSDHLPLYRQSEIYQREGVELDRSTLAGWVGGASSVLAPLVDAIRRYVLQGGKLHGDDTPIPVLAPGNGKTKTGRLWTYVRDDRPSGSTAAPAVWFAYSPDRKSEHPADHLKSFHGTLQADGYAGFNRLYVEGGVTEAACWAHVRRKFNDLFQAHASPIAAEAMQRIGQLYGIEKEIRGRSPEERKQIRNNRAGPLLESMQAWFKESLSKLSKKSDVAVAIHYALGRWPALLRYSKDGNVEIDNNAAERALRAVALGRKNYLFAGSDSGGERAASIYSLIGSAKLNRIDPEAYLSHVLARIADHPIHQIHELLPWNVCLPHIHDTNEADRHPSRCCVHNFDRGHNNCLLPCGDLSQYGVPKTLTYVPISHPFIERLIGTIRRECLDYSLFWTATDLELKLSAFTDYYNRYRVHAALKGHTPIKSTESKRADLKLYRWRKHCRGLYQTPMAA